MRGGTMRRFGERFMFGFDGTTITGLVEDMVVERRVSGIILFSRNISDAIQVAGLCRELQELRRRVSELPLLIAVDQEGGSVNRVADGVTHFPSAMAIAATGDPRLAARAGYCMGRQLAELGINMNFAPVLDINTNRNNPIIGVRSFGDDPARVAAFGAAAIGGLQRAGVAAVAKHFPGLGFAGEDAHVELPLIAKDASELEAEDLVPFRGAVAAGVAGVMVGHARYPALSARPASLSRNIVCDLLKDGMGFEGVVVTDDLEMGAVSIHRGVGDAAAKACGAGADLLLVCHTSSEQINALGDVASAITSGKLRSERIRGSLSRLRALKERIGAWAARPPAEDFEDGEGLAREIAESAITHAGDPKAILPLAPPGSGKVLLLMPRMEILTPAESAAGSAGPLVEECRRRFPRTELVEFDLRPPRGAVAEAAAAVGGAEVVVLGTCNAHLYAEQARLVEEVAGAGRPAVYCALRNPYDIELFPADGARLASYGSDPHSMRALSRVLFGEISPRGRLPVALKL
ncbi:MAG: beta-N-acetylhexosaminidase [bacterium]|nr:beta-N-acetylhexosaminidase [bacterium]